MSACVCVCVSALKHHLDIFLLFAVVVGVQVEVAVGLIVLEKMLAASFELDIAVGRETSGRLLTSQIT